MKWLMRNRLAGLLGVAIAGVLLYLIFVQVADLNEAGKADTPSENKYGSEETAGEDGIYKRFVSLSSSSTNYCAGPDILDKTDAERLQGSCCSAMDFHRYIEQTEGLKKYSEIDVIPPDPYDIPVSLAEELLEYQKTIKLTPQQQAVYDEAMRLSGEGGPCCCKCWRWYAFEGQAKYLITKYAFSSSQIAELWELEDGCGGSGHSH